MIDRFLKAQAGGVYENALQEVRCGKKVTHWSWFVFPQMKGLGHSGMSQYYGIVDRAEAEEYLANPTLSSRLREISEALLVLERRTSLQIFGKIDSKKVHSCMTLFDAICPNDVFAHVLDKYYEGRRCQPTLEILRLQPVGQTKPQPAADNDAAKRVPTAASRAAAPKSSLWSRIKGWFDRK